MAKFPAHQALISTMIYVVTNPASGSKASAQILKDEVLPLLPKKVGRYETKSRGDGVRLGRMIRSQSEEADVVVLGGDGTTHEILNGFFEFSTSAKIRLVIVPTGTANALYAAMYPEQQGRLASLHSFLSNDESKLVPLTLTKNETTSNDGGEKETTLTHLITSHALHAAILHDSDTDEMRKEYPGIERFKVAAQINSINWIGGELKLLGQEVSRYDPAEKQFVKVQETTLKGPFLYLAALTTDRLEPQFVPAPFSSTLTDGGQPKLQRKPDELDLVVVRPARDPAVSDQEEDRIQYAKTRLVEITQAMYNGGKHVGLTYPSGEPIVEYLRTSGYEFTPDQKDVKALLTCLDGTVLSSTFTRATILGDEQSRGKTLVWR